MRRTVHGYATHAALALALVAIGVNNAQAGRGNQSTPAHVITSDRHDTSAPLHTIRPVAPRAGELRELPRKLLPGRVESSPSGEPDAVVQSAPGPVAAPALEIGFEGVNNVNGVLPPDTVGEIGRAHV